MFKNINKDKISDVIIKQIREAIIYGQIKPGDQLPPENKLIEQFGVSRYTLRESLKALENIGLIKIRKGAGGGPIVQEVGLKVTRDAITNFLYQKEISIKQLSEIRKLIEPYLAEKMAVRMNTEQLRHLENLNQACRDSLERGVDIIGGENEIDFHVYLAVQYGNPVLLMILDFANKLLAEIKLVIKPGLEFSREVLIYHEKILKALRDRDAKGAAKAMYEHVEQVEQGIAQLEKIEKAK